MGRETIMAQTLAHLGSKATNRRRDSFPGGHDQRSWCQIFSNVHCLLASTLLVVYKKTLLSFVFNKPRYWSVFFQLARLE